MKSGKPIVPIITSAEALAYSNAVKLVRDVVRRFLLDTVADMKDFLKDTLPGRQGVTPDKLIVGLMRFVRMVTHKAFYDSGFYNDSLPEGGTITIYRERSARIDGI
jgi:hypothetical protein